MLLNPENIKKDILRIIKKNPQNKISIEGLMIELKIGDKEKLETIYQDLIIDVAKKNLDYSAASLSSTYGFLPEQIDKVIEQGRLEFKNEEELLSKDSMINNIDILKKIRDELKNSHVENNTKSSGMFTRNSRK